MLKSIFQKLLVSYVLIILLVFGSIAAGLSFWIESFVFHQKENELIQQTRLIQGWLSEYERGDLTAPQFITQVNLLKSAYGVEMDWFSPPGGAMISGLPYSERKDFSSPDLVDKVFSGETVKMVGDLGHGGNRSLLSIGAPLKGNGQMATAVFISVPVKNINQIIDRANVVIFALAFLVAIPAIFLLSYVARRISKPITHMSEAAALIGQGDFTKRIDVHTRDEVGKLAATFNDMVDRLSRLEQMRKDLVINVSHELRTPITTVRGFIQGILEGVIPPEEQRRYLDIALNELERLGTLITSMLDLSALESGKTDFKPVIIRWNPLVESVAETMDRKISEKQIELRIVSPDQEKININGDPDRLKQILLNLLENAVRHTPQGGSITVESKITGNWLEVEITDTGEGISSEDLPFIWERFYKGDRSRSIHREGSGLGLTITKHLVELHGGSIRAESVAGDGTTFYIRLPAV